MARGILLCAAIAAVFMVNVDSVDAQRRGRVKLNQKFRFLGGGWSAGYHWRTPGHDVEYYNPYSHHNSRLKTGGMPQGAGRYLSQLGGCYGGRAPVDVSSFDQIGSFDQSGGHNGGFMPAIDFSRSVVGPPSNVVDSEVVGEENAGRPRVDYRDGPENGSREPQESIYNRPDVKKAPTPSDVQPSPSDVPAGEDKDVSMWNGFDELEALEGSSFSGGGR